jgi:cytochrome c-type biogenesis protein CcmH/NrfF
MTLLWLVPVVLVAIGVALAVRGWRMDAERDGHGWRHS